MAEKEASPYGDPTLKKKKKKKKFSIVFAFIGIVLPIVPAVLPTL